MAEAVKKPRESTEQKWLESSQAAAQETRVSVHSRPAWLQRKFRISAGNLLIPSLKMQTARISDM